MTQETVRFFSYKESIMSAPGSVSSLTAPEPDLPRRPSKLAGKIFFVVVVVLLLAAIPLVYRTYRLRGVPLVDEPFDVAAARTITVDPTRNAFEYYVRATAAMRSHAVTAERMGKVLDGTWADAEPDIRKWVTDNRAAMDLYRQGAEQPEAVYIQPGDYSYATTLPIVEGMRALTRLACLEAVRLEAEGDDKGAWEMNLAILRTGQHTGRHGCSIERFVGGAIQSMGTDSAVRWAENPRVNAEMLRTALRDVVALRSTTPPHSANLKVEYLTFQKMAASLKSAQAWQELDLHTLLPTSEGPVLSRIECSYGFLQGEPDLSHRIARLAWTNWLSQVDRPREQRSPIGMKGMFERDPKLPKSANLYSDADISKWLSQSRVTQMFLPAIDSCVRACDIQASRQGLLELTLALQLFAREHGGAYPDSLEELRPAYLSQIPADTFGKGEALRYRRESSPAGFNVWSIGPDGVDDLGKVSATRPYKYDILIRMPRPKTDEPAGQKDSRPAPRKG